MMLSSQSSPKARGRTRAEKERNFYSSGAGRCSSVSQVSDLSSRFLTTEVHKVIGRAGKRVPNGSSVPQYFRLPRAHDHTADPLKTNLSAQLCVLRGS